MTLVLTLASCFLPLITQMQPDSTTSHILPVCFYSRGEFKVLYHAEDVHRRLVYYDHEPLVIEAF